MCERCGFHFDHDPTTEEPRGEQCEAAATHIITWVDGRTSVACPMHGSDVLDPDARKLVSFVERMPLPTTPEGK